MAETRAQKTAADRVERESDIKNPEGVDGKRRKSLSSFFETVAAHLMIHDVPGYGKIGKGPNCVIDYGTHVYIPANPTAEHMAHAARLAHEKGWGSVTFFKSSGHGINEKASAAMQKADRTLHVCTDKRQAGSLYKSRLETILHHNVAKASAREAVTIPQSMPQPA